MKKYTKVDRYGRSYIVAPKNKYLKGYLLFGEGVFVEHCLVDDLGGIFTSGAHGGWRYNQASSCYKLIVLDKPVERGNEFGNQSWCWEEWYERNWLCESWAWMHMRSSRFRKILQMSEAV